jgi:phosphoglycolate phosphatase-like HAD superfamily hydrolase
VRRLILFDIDGTLVRGGPAKDAFHVAMLDVFGTAGSIEDHDFSGKTDPQIARELLLGAGFEDDRIDRGFPALWDLYLAELEHRLQDRPMFTLPGVPELLDVLDEMTDVALGLVTGNIVRGARLKLGSVGLHDRFAVGGYGSDHEGRNHLPRIARERARQAWSVEFAREHTVIVGDTPRDVECGRLEGLRTVAVATGNFDIAALERTGADHTFEDFSQTEHVLNVLLA